MKNFLLCLVVFLVPWLILPAGTQNLHPKLDSLLQSALDSMHQVLQNKGMGAAVQVAGGVYWAGAAGISSENPPENISAGHIFNIGSVNKPITAACILQMAAEGLLSLDDSLHRWLDTFPFINPNITIRQLLRHQSGIYDVIGSPAYQPTIAQQPDSVWALADVVKTFIKAPLFQPGAAFSYSNTNYLLLGMIIGEISGNAYHEEIRERFLQPQGLSSFRMPPYEPYDQPVAHLWIDLTGDGVPDDAHDFFSNWAAWYSAAGPAGSYYSTPADIARWMSLLMRGELLPPAIMAQMKTTVNTPFNGGTKYGLGIMERNIAGQLAYGHGGDAGYSAAVWYFPEKDISIAVLNNDGRRTSWSLLPTVIALLKAYTDFENQAVSNHDLLSSNIPLSTFPNPFTEQVSVQLTLPAGAQNLELALTDALGRQVGNAFFDTSAAADEPQLFCLQNLGSLPGGVYYLTALADGKQLAVRRILKQ